MIDADIRAWAYDCSQSDIIAMLEPWQGKLGAVLYSSAYNAAKAPGRHVAFISGAQDAQKLTQAVNAGANFDGSIYEDEDNDKQTARYYAQLAQGIKKAANDAGVPFWGMSTRSDGNAADLVWLRAAAGLLSLPVVCWNPAVTRSSIDRALTAKGVPPWFLSPHPWRPTALPLFNSGWLNWLIDRFRGVTSAWWVEVSTRPQVHAVAFWSLRGYNYGHFGLYDRRGRLTAVGRPVWRKVMGNRRYPTVELSGR